MKTITTVYTKNLTVPRSTQWHAAAALIGAISLLGACASGDDAVVAGQSSDASSADPSSDATSEGSREDAAQVDPSLLFAGFAPGVYDNFVRYDNLEQVIAASGGTVVARFVGYEHNPGYVSGMEKTKEPGIYVPGYAGPYGVMRLYFEVDAVVGGAGDTVVEAPGRAGTRQIAVDIDYWMPISQQEEHFAALDATKSLSRRYVLVLTGGAVGMDSTGAYRLWTGPFGTFAETADETLELVAPDFTLVTKEAVERGKERTPPDQTGEEGEESGDETAAATEPDEPVFGAAEGLTVEQFVERYQEDGSSLPELAGPGETFVG